MEAGEPVLVVSERLGHSTPTTVTAPMRAVASKMANILALDDPADAGKLIPDGKQLILKLTPTGRKLMGEVAQARFGSLCAALGVEGRIT